MQRPGERHGIYAYPWRSVRRLTTSVTTNEQKSAEVIVIVEKNDEGPNFMVVKFNQNVTSRGIRQKTNMDTCY